MHGGSLSVACVCVCVKARTLTVAPSLRAWSPPFHICVHTCAGVVPNSLAIGGARSPQILLLTGKPWWRANTQLHLQIQLAAVPRARRCPVLLHIASAGGATPLTLAHRDQSRWRLLCPLAAVAAGGGGRCAFCTHQDMRKPAAPRAAKCVQIKAIVSAIPLQGPNPRCTPTQFMYIPSPYLRSSYHKCGFMCIEGASGARHLALIAIIKPSPKHSTTSWSAPCLIVVLCKHNPFPF